MTRVVVVGGGFAGLAAARTVARVPGFDVVLLDPRPDAEFQPLLPDCIGRGLDPALLAAPIARAAAAAGFSFRRDAAVDIDPGRGLVATARGAAEPFDFCIVAAGAAPDFRGCEAARRFGLTLASRADAARLLERIAARPADTYVVAGGGYTGIEIATALRVRLARAGVVPRVAIVEAAGRILGPLPRRIRARTAAALERLGISVMTGAVVADAGPATVTIEPGGTIGPATLVWTAGVRALPWFDRPEIPRAAQGRLAADRTLRVAGRILAAGDAAAVGTPPLRMSVQFALAGGAAAGRNAVLLARGRTPRPFAPPDPGFIVPMAHGDASGVVLGTFCAGPAAALLHYAMCLYRLPGAAQRRAAARSLLRSARRPSLHGASPRG